MGEDGKIIGQRDIHVVLCDGAIIDQANVSVVKIVGDMVHVESAGGTILRVPHSNLHYYIIHHPGKDA